MGSTQTGRLEGLFVCCHIDHVIICRLQDVHSTGNTDDILTNHY